MAWTQPVFTGFIGGLGIAVDDNGDVYVVVSRRLRSLRLSD